MIARLYRCPECSKEFRYDHHPSIEADPLPRFCQFCGYDSEAGVMEPALTAPMLGTQHKQVVDQTYRAMEAGAEHRAQLAMEFHGLDQQEANSLKITDLKDNLREGDVAAPQVNNAVSQAMAATPGITGWQAHGGELAASAHTGKHRNAGARAMQGLRQQHQANMAGSGHAGATTSDMPSLETQNPGYRRRA